MGYAVVQIMCSAQGTPTPRDGLYVVEWDPHTKYGVLAVTTTSDIAKARRFKDALEAFEEYRTVSNVQRARPDGRPNRPLTGLTILVDTIGRVNANA